MTPFLDWLTGTFWPAVWGNLAASVIWVPITLIGNHFVVRWHMRRVHRHIEHATGKRAPS